MSVISHVPNVRSKSNRFFVNWQNQDQTRFTTYPRRYYACKTPKLSSLSRDRSVQVKCITDNIRHNITIWNNTGTALSTDRAWLKLGVRRSLTAACCQTATVNNPVFQPIIALDFLYRPIEKRVEPGNISDAPDCIKCFPKMFCPSVDCDDMRWTPHRDVSTSHKNHYSKNRLFMHQWSKLLERKYLYGNLTMKLSWCRINIDFLSLNRQINIEHLCTISLWPLTDKTKTKVFIDPYDICHCASVA